ncbi:MAG TPA: TonB family protein [Gemmatimonadaceae bacterium]|nr:TonB family protein [Gemmatimonadaceae bacterium]
MLPLPPRPAVAAMLGVACLVLVACGGDDGGPGGRAGMRASADSGGMGSAADTPPAIRSGTSPFQYPPALYERRVQANVVLRLFVDSLGRVVPESTLVQERSGYAALDSAAVADARALQFAPARHDGAPVGMPVLLPVHYRHPALDAASRAAPDTAGGRPE